MKRQKLTGSDLIFNTVLYTVATIIFFVVAYPMWFIIIASFSDPNAVNSGKVWFWPSQPTLEGYRELLKTSYLWRGYLNTIMYTTVGTFIGLSVNLSAAYALSRTDLVGKRFFNLYFIFTMFFSGGLVPTFLTIRGFHLDNTFLVMVLPFSVAVYHIIVARTFFRSSMPDGLWDAARIDGCGNLRYFFTIVLPLSKAVIAVIALWTAVGHWNSYFNALIYLREESRLPLQLILRQILVMNQNLATVLFGESAMRAQRVASLIKYASIVVSALPIMCLYPVVQKHFNQGVMIGAIKG
jgi:putative aldouronate transport system permease protein